MRTLVDPRGAWRGAERYICALSRLGYFSNGYIVPTNLKDRDEFHITIEEYLIALTSLVEELVHLSLYHPDSNRCSYLNRLVLRVMPLHWVTTSAQFSSTSLSRMFSQASKFSI